MLSFVSGVRLPVGSSGTTSQIYSHQSDIPAIGNANVWKRKIRKENVLVQHSPAEHGSATHVFPAGLLMRCRPLSEHAGKVSHVGSAEVAVETMCT